MLLAAYGATMAHQVTLWDAGEFLAAIETFGIPHPPGTPLYVAAARAWRLVLAAFPTPVAASSFSALCTATACGLFAWLVARWTRSVAGGVAAGILAGAISSVWLNATEAEVYAASLLTACAMLWCAERARAAPGEGRWVRLLVYLFALSVPLHLSALVATPGAIALAVATDEPPRARISRFLLLSGAAVLAAGAGTVAPRVAGAGLALLVAGVAASPDERGRLGATAAGIALLAVFAVGLSAYATMVLRARLDPAVNQGNPSTLDAFLYVVARKQYDVAPLWPRRAPLWLQIGNMIQYADWQFALGLDSWVGASWRRTPITIAFAFLGVLGSVAHYRADRRSWAAFLILLLGATLGVVVYLNLHAGPSFGWGVIPDDAVREARDRDYFFALGFAAWGVWAGLGAVAVARAIALRDDTWARAIGVIVAALPLALNWRAMNRRTEPAASVPRLFATTVLNSLPPRAVLFVDADNDTYPLWYAQQVGRVRRDVTMVTIPLLGAQWYREEFARRDTLIRRPAPWTGTDPTIRELAEQARARGRPVAMAVSVSPGVRATLGGAWSFRGLSYLWSTGRASDSTRIDRAAADSARRSLAAAGWRDGDPERIDDEVLRSIAHLLDCPGLAVRAASRPDSATAGLLASRCNF